MSMDVKLLWFGMPVVVCRFSVETDLYDSFLALDPEKGCAACLYFVQSLFRDRDRDTCLRLAFLWC